MIVVKSLLLILFIFLSIFGASFVFIAKKNKALSMICGFFIFIVGLFLLGFFEGSIKALVFFVLCICAILWFNLKVIEKSGLTNVYKKQKE
jgi:hypothetical protein